MIGLIRIVLTCCLASAPLAATAQPTAAGAIRGSVTDQQGRAIADASVEAAGPAVAGWRQAMTNEAGTYDLRNLPPGAYALSATKGGFGRTERPSVVVRAGLTVTVDHVLAVGPLDVTVDVVVNQPLFDAARAVQATNLGGDLQARFPLSPRGDWADFLLVTPGVVSNDAGFYHSHGSAFDSHVMQLDGVDLAATAQNINTFVRLNPDAMEDIQVKTAGIDASTPLGAGLVISIAARSGGDALHGRQGLLVRARQWSANNNPGGTTSASTLIHADLSLGGPLQRGRWWFFGAHRLTREHQHISRTPEQLATLRALVPNFEPFGNEASANIPFVKITGQLAPGHQLHGFFQYDRTPSESARPTDGERLSRPLLGGSVLAVGLSSTWRSWLTQLHLSRNAKRGGTDALGRGPAQVVHQRVIASAGVLIGTGPIAFLDNTSSAFLDRSRTWTISADATYAKSGWAGRHEFGVGLNVQTRRDERVTEWTNGGFAQEQSVLRDALNPAAGFIAFNRLTISPASVPSVRSLSHDVAFYARDVWNVGPRLTLNVGVRADVIRRSDDLFDVRTQRGVDLGPRLGATYALVPDGRRVLRAGWGRVHEALSSNTIFVGDDTGAFRTEIDANLDGVFETVFETPRITALSNRLVLDPQRSQPYVNEWLLGYGERLPWWNTSVDVSLIRRAYRNRTAFVDINSRYDGERFVGYANPAVNEIYEVTGNRWNWPVYTGLELRVTRQTDALQFLAGYTRGFQHLAGTWQPNDPASFIQPEAFANDRGIGSVSGGTRPGTSNSLSGFNDVSARQWRDHILRLGVTYQAPWQLLLGTTYSVQSGIWSGPIVTNIPASDPRFGSPTVTLANGRSVQNPLSTTIRFAYPTRGDQQFALPGVHTWNVRVGRTFAIPAFESRAEIVLDLFNVLNLGGEHQFAPGGNQTYSPNFGRGTNRQLPRSVAASARVAF